MSKLFKLKRWLTLPDATKYLSIAFSEEITEADLLRLALDRMLKLSIHLVNGAPAVTCKKIEQHNHPNGECKPPNGEHPYHPQGGAIQQFENGLILQLTTELTNIDAGIWDLPMIGDERYAIESRYQKMTGGPSMVGGALVGTFVTNTLGEYHQLFAHAILMDDAQPGDDQFKQGYLPAIGFPADSVLVVRTDALRELEQSLIEQEEKEAPTSDHVSDKLAVLNQTAQKFWANADPYDRDTHPKNSAVAAWLVDHGFLPTLAERAATIIRPEWAPTGRRPEE